MFLHIAKIIKDIYDCRISTFVLLFLSALFDKIQDDFNINIMKISLICIGKTDEKFIQEGIDKYLKRLKHYIGFQFVVQPDVKNAKNLSENQQKEKEGELFFKYFGPSDYVVLLDERGKELRSIEFAGYIEQKMLASMQHVVFLIGGPYGFSEEVVKRANDKLSLSKLTFSHQMIRLFFVEQVYRAFSILKREPYHHEWF